LYIGVADSFGQVTDSWT